MVLRWCHWRYIHFSTGWSGRHAWICPPICLWVARLVQAIFKSDKRLRVTYTSLRQWQFGPNSLGTKHSDCPTQRVYVGIWRGHLNIEIVCRRVYRDFVRTPNWKKWTFAAVLNVTLEGAMKMTMNGRGEWNPIRCGSCEPHQPAQISNTKAHWAWDDRQWKNARIKPLKFEPLWTRLFVTTLECRTALKMLICTGQSISFGCSQPPPTTTRRVTLWIPRIWRNCAGGGVWLINEQPWQEIMDCCSFRTHQHHMKHHHQPNPTSTLPRSM